MRFKSINLDFVNQRNIENQINLFLENKSEELEKVYKIVQNYFKASPIGDFYLLCPEFKELLQSS